MRRMNATGKGSFSCKSGTVGTWRLGKLGRLDKLQVPPPLRLIAMPSSRHQPRSCREPCYALELGVNLLVPLGQKAGNSGIAQKGRDVAGPQN